MARGDEVTVGKVDIPVLAVTGSAAPAAHTGASRLGGSFADWKIFVAPSGVDHVSCAERLAVERFGVGADTLVESVVVDVVRMIIAAIATEVMASAL